MSFSRSRFKVAIVATHPIQYHVPWYQALARLPDIRLIVLYALLPDSQQQSVGFNVPFKWDIPMFADYEWRALPNAVKRPKLRGFFSSSIPSISKTLAEDRPDVVIVTGWQALPLLQALWACLKLGIPMIVRGESNALRPRPYWLMLLHRLLVHRFDAFLAIGSANRAFYLGYGVDPSQIFECRYFVDNRRIRALFDAALPGRNGLREKWQIPDSRFCFLYVGKLEPKKRVLDLIEAMRIAGRARNDLHLLVVGSGELEEKAKARARELGISITFTGFLNQSELPSAYAAGDCLVLPSDFGETWGLVVNEAMVCGLPVIVSDRVGCGPDLVEHGVTGFVFPFGNAEMAAECLIEMAATPAAAREMGERALQRIQSYSVENAAQGTREAIEFVAAGRSR